MTPGPPQADSFQPNVFQISATGAITAVLTGSLLLQETVNSTGLFGPSAVQWEDASDIIREWIQGNALTGASPGHQLLLSSQADLNNNSNVTVESHESGTSGSAKITFDCNDSGGGTGGQLWDSIGRSKFAQLTPLAKTVVRWGIVQSTGTIFDGSGDFTVAHVGGSGSYTITFTGLNAYTFAPAVLATPIGSAFVAETVTALNNLAFTIVFFGPTSAPADIDTEFSFLCIGT